MYKSGALQIVHESDMFETTDSSRDGYPALKPGEVYLPHSCDSWCIGGMAEITQLIDDLKAVLSGVYKKES